MTLVNMIPKIGLSDDGVCLRIARLFSPVDTLSHVLLWSESDCWKAGDECELSLVELPRLGARFFARTSALAGDADGDATVASTTELFSLDHDDMRIPNSHPLSGDDRDEFTLNLPNSLALMGVYGSKSLFLPNYGLRQLRILSCPLSTTIVADRTKSGWWEHVSCRFYVLPVHNSGAFVSSNTLEAALYLVLLRLVHRSYESAARLLQACQSDTTFTREQRWIMSLFSQTEKDSHPNAHACRLKLAALCQECGEAVPWSDKVSIGEDFEKYLQKLTHVSSFCKLSQTQEKRLLAELKKMGKQDQQDVSMVTLRQTYWKAVNRRAKRNADPDPDKQLLPVVMPMGAADSVQKRPGSMIKQFEENTTALVERITKTGIRHVYVYMYICACGHVS